MLYHAMVGANDIALSKNFYDEILGALGYPPGVFDKKGRVLYVHPDSIFAITVPINGQDATFANGGTIGFKAPSTKAVDAWHALGLEHGGSECEDPPGFRGDNYLAYMRDPYGHKLCAVFAGKGSGA